MHITDMTRFFFSLVRNASHAGLYSSIVARARTIPVHIPVHICYSARFEKLHKQAQNYVSLIANKIWESLSISTSKFMRQAVIQTLRFIAL